MVKPSRILVVDDDETIRALTQEMLAVFGVPSFVAADGRAGVAVLAAHHRANPLSDGAPREEVRERLFAHAAPGVLDVRAVLGHVDVQARVAVAGGLGQATLNEGVVKAAANVVRPGNGVGAAEAAGRLKHGEHAGRTAAEDRRPPGKIHRGV